MTKTFLLKSHNDDVKLLYENHSTYHEGDSGLDLFVMETTTIEPHQTVLVDMGISAQCKSVNKCVWQWLRGNFYKYHSYYLMPRSSIYKTPLLMKNSVGLIDAGYLGPIKAPLYNTSNEIYTLERGDRIVQLVNSNLEPIKFKLVDTLRETSRGKGGFGSTGK